MPQLAEPTTAQDFHMPRIGDTAPEFTAPEFTAESTQGTVHFPSECMSFAVMAEEFRRYNTTQSVSPSTGCTATSPGCAPSGRE